MPILADILAISVNLDNRTVSLSPLSVAVLFSTLDAANRLYDWQGAGFELTREEADGIDELLSIARTELMTLQVGEIKATANANIPVNCLLCDGATYERELYPDLYAALGAAFIVSADEFSVPDLRGKFVGGAVVVGDVGTTGGEAEHTLSVGEMPSHSHTVQATATTLAVEPGEVTVLTPIPIITSFTGDTGGGAAHNNIPPYVALIYYIVAR